MGKDKYFSGQPLLKQILENIDKGEVLRLSKMLNGEYRVRNADCWTHLMVMLYAVIMRFDSLREIQASLEAEEAKIAHLGISGSLSRSTLSDANARRPAEIFEEIYKMLYKSYRNILSFWLAMLMIVVGCFVFYIKIKK